MKNQSNSDSLTTEPNSTLTGDCISPGELVKKHLKDKNHQISDEELANVAVDCHDDAVQDSNETDSGISTTEEGSDDDQKSIAPTPLDIIAS